MLEKAGGPGAAGQVLTAVPMAVAQPSGKGGVRSPGHWGMTPRGQGLGHACLLGPRGEPDQQRGYIPQPCHSPSEPQVPHLKNRASSPAAAGRLE